MNIGVWWTPYIVAVAGQGSCKSAPKTGLPFAITLPESRPSRCMRCSTLTGFPAATWILPGGGGDVIVAVFGELHAVVTLRYRFEAEEALRIGGATPYRVTRSVPAPLSRRQ